MYRDAVIFGAVCGAAATILTALFLLAVGLGALKLVRFMADAFTDACADVEPNEDLDTCKAIDALGVTKRYRR